VRVVDIWDIWDGYIEEEGALDVVSYIGKGCCAVDWWETFPDTEETVVGKIKSVQAGCRDAENVL
jgi:hypothetical protein